MTISYPRRGSLWICGSIIIVCVLFLHCYVLVFSIFKLLLNENFIFVDLGLLRAAFLGVTDVVTVESSSVRNRKEATTDLRPIFLLHTVV